jgi:hypothetical protein
LLEQGREVGAAIEPAPPVVPCAALGVVPVRSNERRRAAAISAPTPARLKPAAHHGRR